MKLFGPAVFAFSAVAAFFLSQSTVLAECQFKKVAEFNLKMDGDHTPLVPVTINGKQGWLVFSNRSNVASMYNDAVQRLGLTPYPTELVTTSGGKEATVYGVHVKSFKLGDMTPIESEMYSVVRPEHSGVDIWGIASTAIFPGDAVEYDLPHKRIAIYSEKYCVGSPLAYWAPETKPIPVQRLDLSTFSGEVDGTAVPMQLNSSQGASSINEAGVAAAKLSRRRSSAGETGAGASSKAESSFHTDDIVTVQTLTVGKDVSHDVTLKVRAASSSGPKGFEPVGNSRTYGDDAPKIILGLDYLLEHRVLVSPTQRLAYITSAPQQ